jgi:hypothetical protein
VTLPRLWTFLAIALPTFAAIIANLSSVDLTYHLRAGAGILGGGGIPTTDSWTFTAFKWLAKLRSAKQMARKLSKKEEQR